MMNRTYKILTIIGIFSTVSRLDTYPTTKNGQKLLLISFDGFRYDLLNETWAPAITAWARENVWFVNGSASQYVTYTAPNHISIVTGLYEESHGIVANYFYDPETKRQEWNGRKDLEGWKKDAEDIAAQLSKKENNFAAWYVSEPDHTLHVNGFFFEGLLKAKILELDRLFEHLLKSLSEAGIMANTNIILTADHGHAEVQGMNRAAALLQIIDRNHLMCVPDFISGEPGTDWEVGDQMVYPNDNQHAQLIYKNLTEAVAKHDFEVKIYWKKDFPERFHYKNNVQEAGEILIVPEIGSEISFKCNASSLLEEYGVNNEKKKFHHSTHGQHPSNPEMRALLVMGGPSLRKGFKVEEVPENIDLFGLMAGLLGVAAPPNNGTQDIGGQNLFANFSLL